MTNPYGTATKRAPAPKPTRPYADVVFNDKSWVNKHTHWVLEVIIDRPYQTPKEIRKAVQIYKGVTLNENIINGCIGRLRDAGAIRGDKVTRRGVKKICVVMGWVVVPENERCV